MNSYSLSAGCTTSTTSWYSRAFVFHDSRGFEAGAVEEFDRVKEFIMERSKELYLRDQLHVIWWVIVDLEFVRSISCPYRYCIPMDDERPFTAAERSFFAECGTGST
jgi:hypothetical protein